MARIPVVGKSEVYLAHRNEAAAKNESNDCAVRAVAALTNTPYEVVHAMMARKGRKARKGTPWPIIGSTLQDLGYKCVLRHAREFIRRYPGSHATALKSVTTHHPDRFPEVWRDGKAYMFSTARHVAAIVNGVNHDWTRGAARRCLAIYEIVRI